METSVEIVGKPVSISMTPAASRALETSAQHLIVEMELYFSCLIRKRVRFLQGARNDSAVQAADKLYIHFRPVMTSHCGTDYEGDEPPLTDFPIKDASAFVPKWLKLDFRRGEWMGEFGY